MRARRSRCRSAPAPPPSPTPAPTGSPRGTAGTRTRTGRTAAGPSARASPGANTTPVPGMVRSRPDTPSTSADAVAPQHASRQRKLVDLASAWLSTCSSDANTPAGPKARPRQIEPAVLDARVREHALVVALRHQAQRADRHREQPQGHQHLGRERRAAGQIDHRLPPQDGVLRHREQHAGHHGRQGRRRFRVGVRQPRVHRREAGLRAVSDDAGRRRPGA